MTAIVKRFAGVFRRPRLQRKLVTSCLVLLALSLGLACLVLILVGNDYRRAKQSYESLRLYQQVLAAANAISAERGPTNTLLGGDFADTSDAWKRLYSFRLSTNVQLAAVLKASVLTGYSSEQEVTQTRAVLDQARKVVDRELSRVFDERTLPGIQEAIAGMFEAVDAIRPLINTTALHSIEGEGDLADEALIGQKLFEIRDYAGRLGSLLAPYIATHRPITSTDHDRLQQVRGRILQLWELTRPYLARHANLRQPIKDVEEVFFIQGMNLVSVLEREGETGEFSYSTRSMTQAIVPTFAPLEAIRTSYLDLMTQRSSEKLEEAFAWLVVTGLVVVLVITIDVILMAWAQRVIFGPLLIARDNIVALSEDRVLSAHRFSNKGGTEIDEVFKALEVLQSRLSERQAVTATLRTHALTDGLTGLLNRRAFDQLGEASAHFTDFPVDVGLVLVDIDYFKSVNDRYGHAAGDRVLKSVAYTLATHVRVGDLVIRYGGEEFAIVLAGPTLEQLKATAETLRAAISKMPIDVGAEPALCITASFGISVGQRGASVWNQLFQEADKALYDAKHSGRNCVRYMTN